MKTWTYQELLNKVEADLDLIGEVFITPSEMMGYFNEAIDQAEAEIHKLSLEDQYFLTSTTLPIVAGQAKYSLPQTIYANKIRRVVYNNGNRVYSVTRLRGSKMFEEMAYTTNNPAVTQDLKYLITNDSPATGPQMVFFPVPAKDEPQSLTVWFIRNANRITALTDVVECPEFTSFIVNYVKARCYEKEMHPNLPMAIQVLQNERALMISTLTEMVLDEDTELERDLSYYEEMS